MEINNYPSPPASLQPESLIIPADSLLAFPRDTDEPISESPVFLSGSSVPITISEMEQKHICPTWGDNTPLISHGTFIRAVAQAAVNVFSTESIKNIDIRVQAPQNGRIPSALYKRNEDLLDTDKTLFYQKCLFCIVLNLTNHVLDKETRIVLGGVRVYETNLSKRKSERFRIFIGNRVTICENMCIFGTNYIDNLDVMSPMDITEAAVRLFSDFDPIQSQQKLESLGNVRISQCQWTKIIGNLRLYEALSIQERRSLGIDNLCTLGDAAINCATRGYVENPNFGRKADGSISAWDMLNLLNESCKAMVLDRFIDRITNAVDFCCGIKDALTGENDRYSWFLTA